MTFHSFDTADDLATALAERVADDLHRAIDQRGTASLVVSGGSTPKPFFQALKRADLPWQHITITLADERWMPPTSDQSNEKLVREHLLTESVHFIPLKNEASTAAEGCTTTEAALRTIPQPFDVTVLGMGTDGHTASLFPSHPSLTNNTPNLCLAIDDAPSAPKERISLSHIALKNTRQLYLHITGDTKRKLYEQAAQTATLALPISMFLQHPHLQTYWSA